MAVKEVTASLNKNYNGVQTIQRSAFNMVSSARLRDLHCMWWLALLVLVSKALAGNEKVGCYKSIPDSYNNAISQDHQSTGMCVETCRFKSLYFALYKGKYCSCGDEAPDPQQITDSCDTPCAGIDSEMCGGDNAYLVYRLTAGDAASGDQPESGASGNSGASLGSKRSSSISTSSTNAATAPAPTTTTNSPTSIVGQGTAEHSSAVITTVTAIITESGQQKTVTTQESVSDAALARSTSSSQRAGKRVKVGTVVGAAVGAFVGLIMALLLLIFILRRIAAKREQERMEKEYQEAIKPIDYDETLYMPKYAGNTSLQESKSSTVVNPFDDNRRVSNGSIVNETIEPNGNVLTVVNPDQ